MNLHPDFIKLVVCALPSEVRDLMLEVGPSLMVAGGFVRDVLTNRTPKDIDIYSRSKAEMQDAILQFDWTDEYSIHYSDNARTFVNHAGGLNVQFIQYRFLRDHYTTLLTFGFSACQAGVYWSGTEWVGIASEIFLEDLPQFKMRLNPDYDGTAPVKRMIDFIARGWKIAPEDIETVLGHFVAEIDEKHHSGLNPMRRKDAISYVKTAFRSMGYGQTINPVPVDIDDIPF